MRHVEDYARLVCLLKRTKEVCLVGIGNDKEAREVVLVVMYVILEHLQPVHPRRRSIADGCPSVTFMLGNVFCRACRVVRLHRFHVRMTREKGVALCKRHRVRVHLLKRVPIVLGQTTDAMFDVQLVLSHHRSTRGAKQFVIVEQASGYGVLYGCHANYGRITAHIVEHLLEGGAAYQLYLLALEILVGGNVVEGALKALYGNSLHIGFLDVSSRPETRKPRFHCQREAVHGL